MLTHLDLFSGIGGFALACQWNGIETIGFVEIDKYCQKVLRKHWPDVPIVEDIRDVEAIKRIVTNPQSERYGKGVQSETTNPYGGCNGRDNKQGIKEIITNARCLGSESGTEVTDNQRAINNQYSGKTWYADRIDNRQSPAILVTAGFPCQPFSVAGKQLSQADDRYLWPQTIAVIKEIKPKWVLLENVTGIINLALDTVLSDLEGAIYATETLVIPACAVNAWHRRDRVWIIANAQQPTGWGGEFLRHLGNEGWQTATAKPEGIQPRDGQSCPDNLESGSPVVAFAKGRKPRQSPEPEGWEDSGRGSQEVIMANPKGDGIPESRRPWARWPGFNNGSVSSRNGGDPDYWAVEPELGRVANGIPGRVDRLKCLGNAIVPQVAYEIIKVIKTIANSTV